MGETAIYRDDNNFGATTYCLIYALFNGASAARIATASASTDYHDHNNHDHSDDLADSCAAGGSRRLGLPYGKYADR
jgi:hypothetical protein